MDSLFSLCFLWSILSFCMLYQFAQIMSFWMGDSRSNCTRTEMKFIFYSLCVQWESWEINCHRVCLLSLEIWYIRFFISSSNLSPVQLFWTHYLQKGIWEYAEQEPVLRILLCSLHQHMAYFTYFIYKLKNLIEFFTTVIVLYPKSDNRWKSTTRFLVSCSTKCLLELGGVAFRKFHKKIACLSSIHTWKYMSCAFLSIFHTAIFLA